MHTDGWQTCHDEEHGFALRHPPDWVATGPSGRCVQFQRGTAREPAGVPEVDVFIRVSPLAADFPHSYLPEGSEAASGQPPDGIVYAHRSEVELNGLPAVRARFRSAGPTPNSGVEYAVRKGDLVLHAYVSQPSPDVEAQFDEVMRTLEW